MKPLPFAIALLLATPAAADGVFGTWKTQVSDTGAYMLVRIAPCGYDTAKTCGVIDQAVGVERDDLVGKAIITGMEPVGAGSWRRGQVWAPDDDRIYRSKMAMIDGRLKVEGCVAVFCRGQIWTRVE